MEKNYKGKLRCATCGSDSHFEFNDDKSYIKCTFCNREYLGGYDELLDLNQESIEDVKSKIAKDAKEEIVNQIKNAFKDDKNFRIK